MMGLTPGASGATSVVKPILVKAGRVLDVKSGQYLLNQGILIEGGIIRQIGALVSVLLAAPKDAIVVDLSHTTLLPGLIDCHAHLLDAMDPAINGANELTLTITKFAPTKRVLLGAAMAREDLEGGFTTIRVLGHSGIEGVACFAITWGAACMPALHACTWNIGSRCLFSSCGQLGKSSDVHSPGRQTQMAFIRRHAKSACLRHPTGLQDQLDSHLRMKRVKRFGDLLLSLRGAAFLRVICRANPLKLYLPIQ